MKKPTLFLLVSGLFVTQLSHATDNPVYIGISAGQTKVIQGANGSYDVATTSTLTAGYVFSDTTDLQSIIEACYTQTLKKESVTLDNLANEYKEETLGIFLAARTKGDAYVKAKLGVVNHRIATNTVVTYNAAKLSAGIGFGIKDNSGGMTEIEYVIYDQDISLVNIGYFF